MSHQTTYAEFFEAKYSKSIAISHMDYLTERCQNRDLYIYGTGDEAICLKRYLELNNIKIGCFIDDHYHSDKMDDIAVIHSIDLLYKEEGRYFIIVADDSESYGVSRTKFIDMGLIEDIDFTYHAEIPGTNELFHYDVTLSFSRIRQKYQGFEVYGDESNPNAIRIVALGGSTTECSLFYVKGWVQFFVEYLKNKGIPAVVYGGGVSSYTSSQELLKLIRDVIPLNPDVVLSYSGVNDIYSFPIFEEVDRYRRPFITRFQVQFIHQILEKLTKEVGIPVVNAPSWNQTGHTTIFYGLQNDKSVSELWIDNMRMMHVLSKEFGITFFSFFQPFRFNGYYKGSIEQEIIHSRRDLTCLPTTAGEKRWGASVKDEVEKIRSEITKYDFIKDFSNIFENEHCVFYDTTHVYEKGNEIIALKILETIVPYISKMKPHQSYPTMESCLKDYSPVAKTKKSLECAPTTNVVHYFMMESENTDLSSNTLRVGDVIHFGKYNWIVLSIMDGCALVLSENIIEKRDYHGCLTNITWEHCDLRKRLNTTFLDNFSATEQERILPVLVLNKNNPRYETQGGCDTVDKIFLLSVEEVEKYLGQHMDRIGIANDETIWWWLRTPGIYSDRAMVIHQIGHAIFPGYYVRTNQSTSGAGVRPALLLAI